MKNNALRNWKVFLFILLLNFSLIKPLSNVFGANNDNDMTLSLVYFETWFPGNAFGYPNFVEAGNFVNGGAEEILLISNLPEGSDVITLCSYGNGELVVNRSKDGDYSQVYQNLVGDFDGNGDLEFLLSEVWSAGLGDHYGSHHQIYDISDSTILKTTSFQYYNPNSIIDRANIFDLKNDTDDEIVFATWDTGNNSELIRIYNYGEEGDLELIANIAHEMPSSDFYLKVIRFVGIGDFNGDTEKEIITVSQWSTNSNPSIYSSSVELYNLDENTGIITHQSTSALNVLGTSIFFEITDINQDMTDELLVYYDKVYSPKLAIYDLSGSTPIEKYVVLRPQSSYPNTGFCANSIQVEDINKDNNIDIVIAETKTDDENKFTGRYEIYSLKENILQSVLLQAITKSPTATTFADIDEFDDLELISAFNDYDSDDYNTKGGIEIWTTGTRKTGGISFTRSNIQLLFMISMPFVLLALFIDKKLEK